MRAIWSGTLSFGLVNIPVQVYSGSRERGINFHLLHRTDLSPVRYARICQNDGREIPYGEIVKGYEIEKGEYITVDESDFLRANPKKTRTMDIEAFTDEASIDPIYFDKPYYLGVEEGAGKAYSLLREALQKTKRVGIARYVFRNREHIGAVRSDNGILVLNQLRFTDEIVRPKGIRAPKPPISKKELSMARKLIDELTVAFHPEHYRDTYVEELEELIRNKARGIEPKTKEVEVKTTETPDLMETLQRSLNRSHPRKAA